LRVFLYLCLRDGGLLNLPELCSSLQLKRPTVGSFIELLETTHLIHRLAPFGRPSLPVNGRALSGAVWRRAIDAMNEIMFVVNACPETGGFVARWDDAPGRGGITTQGDTLAELHAMIADAVAGYFEAEHRPERVRLHFVQDPVLALPCIRLTRSPSAFLRG
jgi:predicted RNase H-like HicB family nuclease